MSFYACSHSVQICTVINRYEQQIRIDVLCHVYMWSVRHDGCYGQLYAPNKHLTKSRTHGPFIHIITYKCPNNAFISPQSGTMGLELGIFHYVDSTFCTTGIAQNVKITWGILFSMYIIHAVSGVLSWSYIGGILNFGILVRTH